MGFALKKTLSVLLSPLTAGLVLLAIAFWRRKQRDTWIFAAAAALVTFGSAMPLVQQLLAAPLEVGLLPHERTRSELPPPAIVVLAGGYWVTPDRQLWDRMSVSTLRRTLEGIRLARMYPEATLYMSGGDAWRNEPPAIAMAELAVQLGIEPKRLRIERRSRDTGDQAVALAASLREAPFLLVTSAYHMPRALTLFRQAGARPIAAPTDFLASADYRFALEDLIPTDVALVGTDDAIHEHIGRLWNYARRQH